MNDTIAVRAEERLPAAVLEAYLRDRLPATGGPFAVRQFDGGYANLTYLVSFGAHEYVLRRPPLGVVPAGAHDMRREHRVLATLHAGFPLAPQSFLLCTDASVIGADFFVMERRRGIAFRHDVPAPWRDEPALLRRVGDMLVDTLADLHAVDPAVVGLGDLGRPEGYVERQVERWAAQWEAAHVDGLAGAAPAIAWLRAHAPRARRTALVHNDYKLDNLLLDERDPARAVAVLDWDMCTRGDPLMDLGYLLALWSQPGEGDAASAWMPTWRAGFSTRREAAARYARRSGAALDDLPWYVAFNTFRFAAILAQIYRRYVRGQTHDERFAGFGERVNLLIARVHTSIETGAFV